MDLSEPSFEHTERRISSRPPTGSRYKRLRREVNAPEELKEMLFKGLRPEALLVLAVALGAAVYLLN